MATPLKKSRSGSSLLADMTALFMRGRYREAASLYDEAVSSKPPVETSFLRARIHLREPHELHKAIALLNGLVVPKNGPLFATKEMLLGEAHAANQDFRSADPRLEAATEAANAYGDPELIAQVAYRVGRRYSLHSDQPNLARAVLPIIAKARSFDLRLDHLHLQSWILSREQRVRDQSLVLEELLALIDPQSDLHMEHRARATHTLAQLAREVYLPQAIPVVERQLGGTPWPPDLQVSRFQATKSIGWAKALQGDYFNAFRYLKQSSDSAPDDAWKTVALTDRAYLAHARGENTWFRQELWDAHEFAGKVHWESREDESVLALLNLAELFAPINPPEASGYLARFLNLGEIRNSRSLMRRDERFTALVDYSTGVVEGQLGNKKVATASLQSAMKTYERCGFEWRAARAALRLFDVTGKSSYLKIAEERLENYMGSWLADELRARKGGSKSTGLSPMRERVFRYLCEGKSNQEIADLLGISVATVSNHCKVVLKTFGVSSRHALIAEAIRRGLMVDAN